MYIETHCPPGKGKHVRALQFRVFLLKLFITFHYYMYVILYFSRSEMIRDDYNQMKREKGESVVRDY